MTPIFGVHFLNTPNLGDQMCSPLRYLYVGRPVRFVDIGQWDGKGDAVIGGGGMLFKEHPRLQELVCNPGGYKRILWGVGTNIHGETKAIYPDWLAKADMVGLRDFTNHGYPVVPCPTCLHPEFDVVRPPPVHDAVVYYHGDYPIPLEQFPRMSNTEHGPDEFWKVLDFLASGKVVISNSYHGLYWAWLLRRNMICWEPFSNRFHHLPRVIDFCTRTDWENVLANSLTHSQPESIVKVLTVRQLNRAFCNRVKEILQ